MEKDRRKLKIKENLYKIYKKIIKKFVKSKKIQRKKQPQKLF